MSIVYCIFAVQNLHCITEQKNISQWKLTKYHLKSITYHFQIQKKLIFDRRL